MAKVCFVPGSGTLAAYLSGEIDHHAAQSLRREIDAQVDERLPELLTLDFPVLRSWIRPEWGSFWDEIVTSYRWEDGLQCKIHRLPCAACWTSPGSPMPERK